MKNLFLPFFLFIMLHAFCQEEFQLAPPLLKYKTIFFDKKTFLEITFNQPGTEVRYTLNGQEPNEKDRIYDKPIPITGRKVMVKARATGNHFKDSDIASVSFFNQGKSIRKIQASPSNPKYSGWGEKTLNDNLGGILNMNAGTWLGFDQDTVEVNIELTKNETISSVLVNILIDEGSWIFLPEQILLYYYDYSHKNYLLTEKEVILNAEPSPRQCSMQTIVPNRKIKSNKLKLILLPVKKIPDWHQGKGNHAWLFIDEIIVY